MACSRTIFALVVVCILAGCETGTGPIGSSDVSRSDYERHKANRQSYMYQGL